MDSSNVSAFLKMHLQSSKYLIQGILGLRLRQRSLRKTPWNIVCFSDRNYAGDPVMRRSVCGFISCLLCVPYLGNEGNREATISSSEKKRVEVLRLLKWRCS